MPLEAPVVLSVRCPHVDGNVFDTHDDGAVRDGRVQSLGDISREWRIAIFVVNDILAVRLDVSRIVDGVAVHKNAFALVI